MEKWSHLIIQTEQDQKGYEEILSRYPPEKVIMFSPEHISQSNMKNEFKLLIEKHGGTLLETKITSISNEKYTNEITTSSLPFDLLYIFINGIKSELPEILEIPIEDRKIVFWATSGSKLHSSLLYSLSLVIGAEIITLDRTENNTTLESQPWVKEGILLAKKSDKELSLLLRNTLRHFLIYFARNAKEKSSQLPLEWMEAKDFTGSKHLPETSGHRTLSLGVEKGLLESDILDNNDECKRYRLTGKGWIVALYLMRQSSKNELIYETKNKTKTELESLKLKMQEYQYLKDSEREFFEGRIMAVRAFKKQDQMLNALKISYNLPEVNKVITLFSRRNDKFEKGIFALKEISEKLNTSEKEKDNFELCYKEWNGNLKVRDTYGGELFISAKGDLESVFIDSSKLIWMKMYSLMQELGDNISWSFDITQLDQQQIVATTLFSQLLGLPMTYVIRKDGIGERGLKVKKLKTAPRFLVLNIPSFETVSLINEGIKNKTLITLIAFYAWSEKENKLNNEQKLKYLSLNELLIKKKNESKKSTDFGVDYGTLYTWFESIKSNYGVSENMDQNQRTHLQDLEDLGMIDSLTKGQGRKKLSKISGLGKIIARWNLNK